MRLRNLLVTMSGGTTSVINSTLAGLIKQNKKLKFFNKILGGNPGLNGVFEKSIIDLTKISDQDLELMKKTPGSSLIGTTRIKHLQNKELKLLGSTFEELGVNHFVNIGGNGTIKQTKSISQYIGKDLYVAAAPKTVDNDLGDPLCSDVFFTPGFPSCVNHWVKIMKLLDIENQGACSHDKVLIGQTFGRETGFLAGATRLFDKDRKKPIIILLPEDIKSINFIIESIEKKLLSFDRCLVIISEGYHIGDIGSVLDASGQNMYGSCKSTAAQLLVDKLISNGIQARAYIPTILQRQDIESTMKFDSDIAFLQGAYIIDQFSKGNSHFLASINKDNIMNNIEDLISSIPFNTFSDFSRNMHESFIDHDKFDVTDLYIDYLENILKLSINNAEKYGFSSNKFLSKLKNI